MRKCPVCDDVSLVEVELQGEEVDRCPQCNGIYFDQGELESIVEMIQLFLSVQLEENEIDTFEASEVSRQMKCPADQSIMEKRDLGGHVMDVCPTCKGIWLDDREIAMLKITEYHIQQNLNLYLRLGQ